jgi:hypothetical protein
MMSLLACVALAVVAQGPVHLVLETAAGGVLEHELSVPLAAPLPDGVAFLRYGGGVSEAVEAAGEVRVEFVDGGRVLGAIRGGEGEFLDVTIVGAVRLRVSVDELASVVVEERIPQGWGRRLEASAEGDRVYRVAARGLERLEGTLEEFTEGGLVFLTSVGRKELEWGEVCALFIEALGDEAEAPPGGTPVIVDLVDGGRVHAGLLEVRADAMDLVTRAGRGLRLPRAVVAEVFVPGAGAMFLSELEPAVVGAQGSPFGDAFGMVWPQRVDRSVTGGLLRAGGELFTRGIGVHAPSRLEWSLDGSWSQLSLGVAVDDEVLALPMHGSVVFRVSVDGETRFESGVLSAGSAVVQVPRISLEGAKALVLEVEMAGNLHVGDRADWLRPVLVR